MKTLVTLLAALFLTVVSVAPAVAQTRTVRHPATGSPALTVDLPGPWTASVDSDNNLIIVGPGNTVALSLSVVDDDQGYTLEEFAKAAFGVANVDDVKPGGEGMIPPYAGATFLGQMQMNGKMLELKLLISRVPDDKIVSATIITGPDTSTEDAAVGEMILKTIRVVR